MVRPSRIAFYVILVVVGAFLALYVPEPDDVGSTPTSEWMTFSSDRSATAIRRNLRRAHHAEAEANRLRRRGSRQARRHYRRALDHYERAARYLLRHRSRGGYLQQMTRRGRRRIRARLDASGSTEARESVSN